MDRTRRDQVPYIRVSGPPFVAQLVDDNGTQLGFLPCFKPPWARLFAVEASTGEIAWEVPLGINKLLPEGKQKVGSHGVGGPMVTASGLTFIGGHRRPKVPSVRHPGRARSSGP